MTYNIISTGSKGNAVLLEGGVLIDCGVSFKKIEQIAKELKLVLLTHIHGDHFNRSTLKRLAHERPMLRFACCEWLVPELSKCVSARQIDVLECDSWYSYGAVTISPVRLVHSVPNCGWRLFYSDDAKVLYATDTGNMDSISARGYEYYFVECNYDNAELQERKAAKLKAGEFAYEALAELNHMSREQVTQWLSLNSSTDSKVVFLHQHTD